MLEQLEFVGYEKLSNTGLALPIFGRSQYANQHYIAHPDKSVHSRVMEFEEYEPYLLTRIDQSQMQSVYLGSPFPLVFLLEDEVWYGSAPVIWRSISQNLEVYEKVKSIAPLSLLKLARLVEDDSIPELIMCSKNYLKSRHGKKTSSKWAKNNTLNIYAKSKYSEALDRLTSMNVWYEEIDDPQRRIRIYASVFFSRSEFFLPSGGNIRLGLKSVNLEILVPDWLPVSIDRASVNHFYEPSVVKRLSISSNETTTKLDFGKTAGAIHASTLHSKKVTNSETVEQSVPFFSVDPIAGGGSSAVYWRLETKENTLLDGCPWDSIRTPLVDLIFPTTYNIREARISVRLTCREQNLNFQKDYSNTRIFPKLPWSYSRKAKINTEGKNKFFSELDQLNNLSRDGKIILRSALLKGPPISSA